MNSWRGRKRVLDIRRGNDETRIREVGFYMINKDFEYFNNHREELLKDHKNEYVVIKDASIVGFFKEQAEAFKAMRDSELGTFIVQKCIPESEEIKEFHTRRVAFA